jgi:hypothetical protein
MKIFPIVANLFFRPQKAFQLLLDHPKSFWWLVLLFAMVVFVSKTIIANNLELQKLDGMYSTDVITDESGVMVEDSNGAMAPMPVDGVTPVTAESSPLAMLLPIVATIFIVLIASLIWATFLHITTVMAGGNNTFKQMLAMVSLSWLPAIVKNILQIVVMLVSGKPVTAEGLENLVGANQMLSEGIPGVGGVLSLGEQILQEFLKHVNIFTLWFLFLLVVGTAVTGKLKRRSALWVAILCWAVIMLIKLIPILVISSIGF